MNAPAGGKAATTALADFVAINEEIAALVRAKLPIESHLKRVGADLPGNAGVLAARIGDRLEAGETLADAMDAECGSLPAAYRAVMVAGAESGNLGAAIESLVDTATRADQLRRVTGVALLYPLIVVFIALSLLSFILAKIIPSFEWVDLDFGWLTDLAHVPWLGSVLSLYLPAAMFLGFAVWWIWSARLSASQAALAWLPGFRRVWKSGEAAKFADILRLLVDRGLPLDRSLQLAGDAVADERVRTAAHEFAARIQRGEISAPPARESVHDELYAMPRLIRLALYHVTDRRLLSASLEQAATLYRDRAIRAAEWYSEFMPIIATLLLAGTVTIAFALIVFWPYSTMLHELSKWNWG
jgi:general secretion pathway protein F